MTCKEKERTRELIEREGWTIIHPACELPPPNETVKLMYMDMDGHTCICRAHMVTPPASREYWRGDSDPVKGNRMVGLIAWIKEER